MRKFGLIGFPLGHSFSKGYFREKFEKENISGCQYDNYPLESIHGLTALCAEDRELEGLNVTIPYKQQVIPFLHSIDEEARAIGAVNCLKITRDPGNAHRIKGFNTDCYGFETPLKNALKEYHTKALILGTGGASKAVEHVLKKLEIPFTYVSRKPANEHILSYQKLNEEIISEFKIIVNTSPLGMYPDIGSCPDIPYSGITSHHILYDLVYNPELTLFLKLGKEKKATTINGLPMLYLQAERSWEIWNQDQ